MGSSSTINLPANPIPDFIIPLILNLLPRLSWVIFGLVILGFSIMSLIFLYHWRVHGRGVFIFFLASTIYFVVSAILIWGAFTFLIMGS
jgi:hypothetical protein